MDSRIKLVATSILIGSLITGCASTYGNLVSGNKLGANEYQPAVYVHEGNQEKYRQILEMCRRAAANRQVTAAQEGQLNTITGVTQGTIGGATTGAEIGAIFNQAGLNHSSIGGAAGIGAASGLLSSLGDAFAFGAKHDASESRRALLNCLRSQQAVAGYTVLE